MRKRINWTFAVLAIALFIGSFALTYGRLSLPNSVDQLDSGNLDKAERLSAKAMVRLRYVMADGRRASEESKPPTAVDANATLDDLQRLHANWSIIKFSPEEIVAEVRCEAHTGGYLGSKDGWVAAYDGTYGKCSVLRELTEIPVESVHPEEREKLTQGTLKYTDENNLQELLDGLISD